MAPGLREARGGMTKGPGAGLPGVGGELEDAQGLGLEFVGGVGVGEGLGDAGDGVHHAAGGQAAALDEVRQNGVALFIGEPQLLRHQLDGLLRLLNRGGGVLFHPRDDGADVAGSRNRATASRALAVISSRFLR
jgi:hypothetical protein